jgi:hypothetical protein
MAGPYRVQERELLLAGGSNRAAADVLPSRGRQPRTGISEFLSGLPERYSKSIGPYPYAQFSIVSSPLPAGLGMPTLTYLGIDAAAAVHPGLFTRP